MKEFIINYYCADPELCCHKGRCSSPDLCNKEDAKRLLKEEQEFSRKSYERKSE